ncbi:MAG TPA: hypothetical protein VK507_22400 [Iamia sp.]|nr:hypothetical protein [Iamia sp.]
MSAMSGWQLEPVEVREATPDPVPPRPSTLRGAVTLMVAGAVLAVVDAVVALVVWDRDDLEQRLASADINPGNLDGFVIIVLVVGFVGGLVAAGLWSLTAVGCSRGRGWARTWATVLGGLYAAVSLAGLAGAAFGPAGAYRLLKIAIAVAAVVLLWLPPSRAFFRTAATRR